MNLKMLIFGKIVAMLQCFSEHPVEIEVHFNFNNLRQVRFCGSLSCQYALALKEATLTVSSFFVFTLNDLKQNMKVKR